MNFEDDERYQINIAICGAVSAGKSTLLNSLFVSQYSDMKIKRTTMTPQVYYENQKCSKSVNNEIKEANTLINKKLLEKGEKGEQVNIEDIKETTYTVPPVYNLVSLHPNVMLTVYDIPGLNDGTNNVYYEYLEKNFYKFDIILFIIDINSALNTSDEVKILENILEYSKRNLDNYNIHNKLIVLANKCDDMSFGEKGEFVLDDEFSEMYDQINKIVKQKVQKIFPSLEYSILPLASEDSYIYRMYDRDPEYDLDIKHVNKFGYYEYGKSRWNKLSDQAKKEKIKHLMKDIDIDDTLTLTGFNEFKKKLQVYLKPKEQYKYLLNHILYNINKLDNYKQIDIMEDVKIFYKYFERIKSLNNIFSINKFCKFTEVINKYFENYTEKIIKGYINIENDSLLNNTNIDVVLKIKDQLDEICMLFQANIPSIKALEMNQHITTSVNKVLVNDINSKTKPIKLAYDYFMKLFKYGYEITKEITFNFFTNNNMLKQNPKKIIEYFEDLEMKKLITFSDKVENIEKMLITIYNNGFRNTYIPENSINLMWASYLTDTFWHSQNSEYFSFDSGNANIPSVFLNLGIASKRNVVKYGFHNDPNLELIMKPEYNDYLELERYYLSLIDCGKTQKTKYHIEDTNIFIPSVQVNAIQIQDSNYSYDIQDANLSDDLDRELGLSNTKSRKKKGKKKK
ncbi:Dynamin family [seawater metagenome]|uniref:Dynamin family n=1 Tax=seawater metagenome TaxID=1561972 RepID=A0A5E8CI91_9ZZZZ